MIAGLAAAPQSGQRFFGFLSGGGGDPELCMVEVLRGLKFPASATGADSTLTFPMAFGR